MGSKLDILKKAEEITPIATKNGMDIVSFEDAIVKQQAEMIEGSNGRSMVTYNADGSVARSRTSVAALNYDLVMRNRFRYVEDAEGKKKLQIVVDPLAIATQTTGRVYASRITAYEVERNKKGKIVVTKAITVSDDEFVADFSKQLSNRDMAMILPMIDAVGGDVTVEDIAI